MARIAGVNIPTNKRVEIALRYIHGIGPAKAREICDAVGIKSDRRVQDLTDAEVLSIRETIDRDHQVEGLAAALAAAGPALHVLAVALDDRRHPVVDQLQVPQ